MEYQTDPAYWAAGECFDGDCSTPLQPIVIQPIIGFPEAGAYGENDDNETESDVVFCVKLDHAYALQTRGVLR